MKHSAPIVGIMVLGLVGTACGLLIYFSARSAFVRTARLSAPIYLHDAGPVLATSSAIQEPAPVSRVAEPLPPIELCGSDEPTTPGPDILRAEIRALEYRLAQCPGSPYGAMLAGGELDGATQEERCALRAWIELYPVELRPGEVLWMIDEWRRGWDDSAACLFFGEQRLGAMYSRLCGE